MQNGPRLKIHEEISLWHGYIEMLYTCLISTVSAYYRFVRSLQRAWQHYNFIYDWKQLTDTVLMSEYIAETLGGLPTQDRENFNDY